MNDMKKIKAFAWVIGAAAFAWLIFIFFISINLLFVRGI